jgi:hypothetical protein
VGKISQSYLKDKFLSKDGYKRNSPDVNNPYNVIPSNQITMEGVDFPVMGIDDIGNQQMMYPGNNYTFPGNYVTEFPVKNMGNKRFGQVGFQNTGEISTEDSPIEMPYVEIRAKRNPLAGVKPLKREPGARSPLAKNAQPQDQLRTQYYRKPEEQMAGISETKKEDLRRKISGVLRETTQADKDWAAEQANRKALTFSGATDGSVLGGMLDLVNPFSYYYAGKDAVRGAGETAQAIYEGNPDAVAAGLFKTGLNAAAFLPATQVGKFANAIGTEARLINRLKPLSVQRNLGDISKEAYKSLGRKAYQEAARNPFNVSEYLTQGPLRSAFKQLPVSSNVDDVALQFTENPNSYYRMVGEAGYDDLIKQGYIRTNPNTKPAEWQVASRYEPNKAWFNKGSVLNTKYDEFGKPLNVGYKGPYMVEVSDIDMITESGKLGRTYGYPKEKLTLNNPNLKIWKEDGKGGFIQVPKKLPGSPNTINQAGIGFIDVKGAFQKYPKGPLTQEEIAAYRNSPYYQKATKEHLDMVNKYGDQWTLGNYMEDALQEAITKGTRSRVNPILYGGRNWGTSDYVIAGLASTAYPAYAGIMGLASSPPAVKNKALSKMGIIDPTEYGLLSKKDTTIDITNRPMSFAKVNQTADGNIIIGGEFIEDANNTVRKAKDWLSATDTYSDKKYSSKDIQSFYGIENGKFKVGKANEFNPETEIVPRRFGATNIDKAVLNGEEMRLLDKQGNPIYQNTPNTGKFILYSPSTGKAEFTYINTGKSGVNKVNDFLKKNKDAQYIHLDNGRYEYYGINPEGLTEQDFKTYYEQDFKREGNPGYNMILKKYGGLISKPKGTYQMGGTMGIPGVNGQVVSSGPQPLTSVKKTRGPITKTKAGVKTMSSKQVKKILKNIK